MEQIIETTMLADWDSPAYLTTMRDAKVLVAEPQEIVRCGILHVLKQQNGLSVVAEATDTQSALSLSFALQPDVIVFGLSLKAGGLDTIRKLIEVRPKLSILVFSAEDSDEVIQDCLAAGATSFLSKADPVKDLVGAIRVLASGQPYLAPRVAETLFRNIRGTQSAGGSRPSHSLTFREQQVVSSVAEGKTNKEIAMMLGISVRTVESHRSNIMEKKGFHSVADLVRFAMGTGLIDKQSPTAAANGRVAC